MRLVCREAVASGVLCVSLRVLAVEAVLAVVLGDFLTAFESVIEEKNYQKHQRRQARRSFLSAAAKAVHRVDRRQEAGASLTNWLEIRKFIV